MTWRLQDLFLGVVGVDPSHSHLGRGACICQTADGRVGKVGEEQRCVCSFRASENEEPYPGYLEKKLGR